MNNTKFMVIVVCVVYVQTKDDSRTWRGVNVNLQTQRALSGRRKFVNLATEGVWKIHTLFFRVQRLNNNNNKNSLYSILKKTRLSLI